MATAPSENVPLLQCGPSPGCRVEICSSGGSAGLLGNPCCLWAWSPSCPPPPGAWALCCFSLALGLLLGLCLLCPFGNLFSPRHRQLGAGLSWALPWGHWSHHRGPAATGQHLGTDTQYTFLWLFLRMKLFLPIGTHFAPGRCCSMLQVHHIRSLTVTDSEPETTIQKSGKRQGEPHTSSNHLLMRDHFSEGKWGCRAALRRPSIIKKAKAPWHCGVWQ